MRREVSGETVNRRGHSQSGARYAKLGVEAAKSAWMGVIGHRNSNSGDHDLSRADMIIHDFSELSVEEILA